MQLAERVVVRPSRRLPQQADGALVPVGEFAVVSRAEPTGRAAHVERLRKGEGTPRVQGDGSQPWLPRADPRLRLGSAHLRAARQPGVPVGTVELGGGQRAPGSAAIR